MKMLLRTIHYLILTGALVHGVRIGLNEGFLKGLLAFVMFVFFYFVVYRLFVGPRDLSYGYKNGYRPAIIHEEKAVLAGSLPVDGFDRNCPNNINEINNRF